MTTKKLLQRSALFGMTCLALIISLIALPEILVSAETINGSAIQARPGSVDALRPQGQGPLNLRPITSLTLTLSSPAATNRPTTFTASASGASPILFSWDFGDGNSSPLSDSPTRSNTYLMIGTYTVVVTAVNGFDNLDFATESITIEVGPNLLYLPVAFKNFNFPPPPQADLACTNLQIDPLSPAVGQAVRVTVQIANQGQVEADGFWVDLYVDPDPNGLPKPGRENRIRWDDACGGINTCQRGIAWRVSKSPLAPTQSRTFVSIPNTLNPSNGQGFDPTNSAWPDGLFTAGEHKLYAYVDSINGLAVIDGAVDEGDETNNRCEKVFTVSPASSSTRLDQPNPPPSR
jgi:PKD repeat protein